MDVDKILISDDRERLISKATLDLAERKIENYYSRNAGGEKLVIPGSGGTSNFEVGFSKGEGMVVLERREVTDASVTKTMQGLKVTFRRDGIIRIDDVNQDPIVSGGVFHTVYARCNEQGLIKFYSSNETQSNPGHLHELLNKDLPEGQDNWPGFNKRNITHKYKIAVFDAIFVLKKICQS